MVGLEDAVLIRTSNTLKYEDNYVLMLDRRRFPEQELWQRYSGYEEVATAIEDMVIQGAGSVAFAACFGLALAARRYSSQGDGEFEASITKAAERLKATRPTGEYLVPLVEKMRRLALKARAEGMDPAQAIVAETE